MGFTVSVQDTRKLELAANPLLAECNASLNAALPEDVSNKKMLLRFMPFTPTCCIKRGGLCTSGCPLPLMLHNTWLLCRGMLRATFCLWKGLQVMVAQLVE